MIEMLSIELYEPLFKNMVSLTYTGMQLYVR